MQKIAAALQQLGCSLNDAVRTRIFARAISKWEGIGKLPGEFFKNTPVATLVDVSRLINKDLLIEIEDSLNALLIEG
ncbi:MAG TPA: Rid family hydrolase [Ferruginibacter sp.]|nr:Rid family hydrolase [Ferruginibacter sp.]